MINWIVDKIAEKRARYEKKLMQERCNHSWQILSTCHVENGFGLRGTLTEKRCMKCGLHIEQVYYP